MNNQNPNQQGGGSTPAQLANMLTKAIREEMAAQRSMAEKTLGLLLTKNSEELKAVADAEAQRLSKQFEDAQKKLRLADNRETGLAIRESELKSLEASLAHREKELDSRARVNQQRAEELARAEKLHRDRMEEIEKKAEHAEKFLALQLLREKQLRENQHKELQLQADLKAAQDNYVAEKEAHDYETTAQEAAMAAAMSFYAPELEELLQQRADEYKNDQHDLDAAPKSNSKRKAPAKKNVAVPLKEQLPAKEAPEALPEI